MCLDGSALLALSTFAQGQSVIYDVLHAIVQKNQRPSRANVSYGAMARSTPLPNLAVALCEAICQQ